MPQGNKIAGFLVYSASSLSRLACIMVKKRFSSSVS